MCTNRREGLSVAPRLVKGSLMNRVTSGLNLAFVTACFVGASLAMPVGPVKADLIAFDTFGTGDSYNTDYNYGVDGSTEW